MKFKNIIIFFFIFYYKFLHAEQIFKFKENENLNLVLSNSNFNRLIVKNDKINNLRFPKGYLSAENDVDGSVYIDILNTEQPFTLFFSTKKGKHFSATINSKEQYGQTIKFINQKNKKNIIKKSSLLDVINAVSAEKQYSGFSLKKVSDKKISLLKNVFVLESFALANKKNLIQKYIITNNTKRDISFNENWFKNKNMQGLFFKKSLISPNESISVIRVQGI